MARKVYIGAQTITNMISNGIFNSLDGWNVNGIGSSYAKISNGTLYCTVPTTNTTYKFAYTAKTISLVSGHKYYCSVQVKKTGGGVTRWGMHNNSTNTSYWLQAISDNHSALTRISYLYTATASAATHFLLYSAGQTWASGMTVTWDNLFVVDLTELYGAGKEPTKAQCDSKFSMSDDGVISCADDVGAAARNVKDMYVGVGNVARKIKRGYIGVNGVVRMFFAGVWDQLGLTAITFHKTSSISGQYEVTASFAGRNSDGYWELSQTVNYLGSGTANGRYTGMYIYGNNLAGKKLSFSYWSDKYSLGNYTNNIHFVKADGSDASSAHLEKTQAWSEYSKTIPSNTAHIYIDIWSRPTSSNKTYTSKLLLADVCIDGQNIM